MKRIVLLFAVLVSAVSCSDEHQSVVTFEQEEVTLQVGKTMYTYLLDGNGEYQWTFSEEGIAEVVAIQYGTVRLKAVAAGSTVLTLTDRLGTSDDLVINVVETL